MIAGNFLWVALVSSLAILVTYLALLNAGIGRIKYKIPAPSHDGPDEYVRRVRAHMNTVEHLVMFLPALWTFALVVSPLAAAIIGAIWPVGRFFYIYQYTKDAAKRRLPLYVTMPAVYILILGSIIGTLYRLVMG